MARYTSLIRDDRPRVRETVAPKRAGLTVNDLYEHLKEMAVLYTIRPGERVNELELAEKFNVSRTPLREALNRLVAENLLSFVPNRGFYVRQLDRQDVFDLYELRNSIESAAVQLATRRAEDKDIKALRKFWKDVLKEKIKIPSEELVIKDEEFHVRLVALSGNNEMVRSLYSINARIHFVRWIDLEQRGTPRDYSKAFTWYLKAAKSGDEASEYIVASFYEKGGDGVKINYTSARLWYALAAQQGDLAAAAKYAEVAARQKETHSDDPDHMPPPHAPTAPQSGSSAATLL